MANHQSSDLPDNKPENRAFQEMLAVAKERLQHRDPTDIAVKTNSLWEQDKKQLTIRSLNQLIEIRFPDYQVMPQMEEWHHLVLFHYLDQADESPVSQTWITFGNLKDGLIRGTKFDRTAEMELERIFRTSTPKEITEACQMLGAEFPESKADLCAVFSFFPKYPVAMNIWFADEEFPASGKLFLQANADACLTVEDAVTVGSILISKLEEILNRLQQKRSGER